VKLKNSRALVAIFAVLLLAARVKAQDVDDVTWYWAWRESDGALLAYNVNGDVNTLLTGINFYTWSRVNPQLAIGVIGTDESYGVYKLTPDQAIRVSEEIEGAPPTGVGFYDYRIIALSESYVLLDIGLDGWLIDLETNTTTILDFSFLGLGSEPQFRCAPTFHCVRFSRDGQTLRYIGSPDSSVENAIWSLYERVLSSGEEQVIYAYVNPEPDAQFFSTTCNPDLYGERWLCEEYFQFDSSELRGFWLLSSDGRTRTVAENTELVYRWNVFLSNDALFVVDEACQSECFIQVWPSEDEEPLLFSGDGRGSAPPSYLLEGDRLLLYNRSGIYSLVQMDGTALPLGTLFCCELTHTESPDGHWIVTMQENVHVWNLMIEEIEFELEPLFVTSVNYQELGFIISALGRYTQWINLYSGQHYEIARREYGWFFAIPTEDYLLYEQSYAVHSLTQGIYRYNLEDEEFELIVEGATTANMQR